MSHFENKLSTMFDVGSRNLLCKKFALFSMLPLICSFKTHTANDRHSCTTFLWVDPYIVKLRVDIISSLDIALLFPRCILTLPSQMYSNEWYLLMQNRVRVSLTEVLFFCCALITYSNGAIWLNRSANRLSSRHDNVSYQFRLSRAHPSIHEVLYTSAALWK